eukprot:gene14737-17303_t
MNTILLAVTSSTVAWTEDANAFLKPATGGVGDAPKTLVPTTNGAVCLDGTPGAYYHLPGTGSGANKWYVHHQGGGWCESLDDCLSRSKGGLGSSKSYPPTMNLGGGYFSTDPTQNPLMYNWNKVHMNYCDGASFSGNNDTVQIYQNVSLHWRGSRIRENIVADLMGKGLSDASDLMVSGCSAGGLATYLHTDQWCDAFPKAKYADAPCNPPSTDMLGNTVPGDYHCGLKWTYTVQNATAGINKDCVAAHEATGDVWKCMFAEHSAEHIKHPVFAMQSQYDSWQTGHVLKNAPRDTQTLGNNITSRIQSMLMANNNESGAFLDSYKWYNSIGVRNAKKLWNQDQKYPCTACCQPHNVPPQVVEV